jgi:hypothetical protein
MVSGLDLDLKSMEWATGRWREISQVLSGETDEVDFYALTNDLSNHTLVLNEVA